MNLTILLATQVQELILFKNNVKGTGRSLDGVSSIDDDLGFVLEHSTALL